MAIQEFLDLEHRTGEGLEKKHTKEQYPTHPENHKEMVMVRAKRLKE